MQRRVVGRFKDPELVPVKLVRHVLLADISSADNDVLRVVEEEAAGVWVEIVSGVDVPLLP